MNANPQVLPDWLYNSSTIIFDVDNTLFPYPEGYDRQFSVATARAVKAIAGQKLKPDGDQRLVHLVCADEDQLTEEAVQSYREHGSTVEVFARRYGLNREDLYQAHHYLMYRDVVKPTFARYANPRLQQGLANLRQVGMDLHGFTDGTEFYCIEVVKALGLKNYFSHLSGTDSHRERHYAFKSKRVAWLDYLAAKKIPSETGYVIGETNKAMTVEDAQWPHVVIVDDSPEKLRAAKHYGLKTILKTTDRVQLTEEDKRFIDLQVDDLGEFTNLWADRLRHQKRAAGQHPPCPVLKAV